MWLRLVKGLSLCSVNAINPIIILFRLIFNIAGSFIQYLLFVIIHTKWNLSFDDLSIQKKRWKFPVKAWALPSHVKNAFQNRRLKAKSVDGNLIRLPTDGPKRILTGHVRRVLAVTQPGCLAPIRLHLNTSLEKSWGAIFLCMIKVLHLFFGIFHLGFDWIARMKKEYLKKT